MSKNNNLEDSVVQIICKAKNDDKIVSLGTGFFLDSDVICTAHHVINNTDESNIFVVPICLGICEIKANIINFESKNRFVALLKLEKEVKTAKILKFVKGYSKCLKR